MAELLHISYSPWSEKARWALDLAGVPHERTHYQPLLGEPALRFLLKKPFGNVSVPVFRDGPVVLGDSFEIARHAAQKGAPWLCPAGRDPELTRYNELSERGLSAGRVLSLQRMLGDERALAEMVPKALRKQLGKLALPIASFGVRRTLKKYAKDAHQLEKYEAVLIDVLETLRRELAVSDQNPAVLLGSFSYADIAMAQVLAFVTPPAAGIRIGENSRVSFTHPALAARFSDLLAWRDALYAKYREAKQEAA